jgi:hypothetical protein
MRFEVAAQRWRRPCRKFTRMPPWSDHVVLNITDALICQYQGEQTSLLHYSTELNQIWISKDPVALDTLGIQELDRERQAKDLESHGDNPELYPKRGPAATRAWPTRPRSSWRLSSRGNNPRIFLASCTRLMPTLKAAMRMDTFCLRLNASTCTKAPSRMRNNLSITSVSVQKKLCKSCTHSK